MTTPVVVHPLEHQQAAVYDGHQGQAQQLVEVSVEKIGFVASQNGAEQVHCKTKWKTIRLG